MTYDSLTLTPAQIAFVRSHVAGFKVGEWVYESAGQAGSDRRFVRISRTSTGESYVIVIWDSADADWKRFVAVEEDLRSTVDFLPRVHAHDEKHGLILEEDLGGCTLGALIRGESHDTRSVRDAYVSVVDSLVVWQNVDPALCPTITKRAMDEEMFLWESEYFATHCVTEFFGLERLLDDAWEQERYMIAQRAAALPRVCIHRDFQSENILVKDGKVRFVDFQGARLGPAGYDLASLLLDPYVEGLDEETVDSLLSHYRNHSRLELSDADFRLCAVQRLMQALGAYANLSIHKGKDRYRAYVPVALGRLAGLVKGRAEFAELRRIVEGCGG